MSTYTVAADAVPICRVDKAIKKGVNKNILFKVAGGIGDVICAEPTLRFALRNFKDCQISLATAFPEVFRHLIFDPYPEMMRLPIFKNCFDLKNQKPNLDEYLVFETYLDNQNFSSQFFCPSLTHCVDYASIASIRRQLPTDYKTLQISSRRSQYMHFVMDSSSHRNFVFIHPGSGWQSKTFPVEFWDQVISGVIKRGKTPIIIGTHDKTQPVDVSSLRLFDARSVFSIEESIYILQEAQVLLTNDSAPLHMASSGNAWIGLIATCKHPDFITHWRKGALGYRVKNFSKAGMWSIQDYCPNKQENVMINNVDPEILKSWLPDPDRYAAWAVERLE